MLIISHNSHWLLLFISALIIIHAVAKSLKMSAIDFYSVFIMSHFNDQCDFCSHFKMSIFTTSAYRTFSHRMYTWLWKLVERNKNQLYFHFLFFFSRSLLHFSNSSAIHVQWNSEKSNWIPYNKWLVQEKFCLAEYIRRKNQ